MIVQYGVQCSACGDRLFSNYRYDFVRCRCSATFIDGGFDYQRGGWDPALVSDWGTPITRNLRSRPKRYYRQSKGPKRVYRPSNLPRTP